MRFAPDSRPISALMFDMDGLLVDSEPLGRSTMMSLLRGYNQAWQPDAGRHLAGRRLPEIMAAVAETYGLVEARPWLAAGGVGRVAR